jgi:hypothetical protein
MRIVRTALFGVGSFILMATLFAYWELALFTPAPFAESGYYNVAKPVLLAGCSLLGIFSKSTFDALSQRRNWGHATSALVEALAPSNLLRAIIVCPIVIISFYQSIQQIGDFLLIGLIAYQNGFFFETVLKSGESRTGKDG